MGCIRSPGKDPVLYYCCGVSHSSRSWQLSASRQRQPHLCSLADFPSKGSSFFGFSFKGAFGTCSNKNKAPVALQQVNFELFLVIKALAVVLKLEIRELWEQGKHFVAQKLVLRR